MVSSLSPYLILLFCVWLFGFNSVVDYIGERVVVPIVVVPS